MLAIPDGLDARSQVTVSQPAEEPFAQSGLDLPVLWPQPAKDVRQSSSHLVERERRNRPDQQAVQYLDWV